MSHLDLSESGFWPSAIRSRYAVTIIRFTHLEVQVVLAVTVELGRGNVKTDLDLASVAGLLDGLGEEVERLVGARHVGGKATLVTNVGGYLSAHVAPCNELNRHTVKAVLLGDDLLQDVVGLGTHLEGLGEGRSAGGEDHELLEGKLVAGVLTAVDDVERGAWEDVGLGDASELGEVGVEGKALTVSSSCTPLLWRKYGELRTFSAAAASETAMETAKMALAPSLPLLWVPSSLIMRSSISFCEVTGSLDSIKAGAMIELTLSTAFKTPIN